MNIKTLKLGPLETNCYILNIENDYIIIDPADNIDKITKNIKGNLIAILVTHYHFDHIGCLKELSNIYQVPIYDYKQSNQNVKIKKFQIKIIPFPGHKEDLVGFLFENKLFSGDFIFNGTIGRFDLPGGDLKEMQSSIKYLLKNYTELEIYPGHGEPTTLQKERNNLISYLWIRMTIINSFIKLNIIKINKQN